MKRIDTPSSIAATQTAGEDPSPTSLLPAVQADINMFADTETLRVLEVRPPTRGVERFDTRDAYDVSIEERFESARPALTLVPATPRAAPAPAVKPPAPAAPKSAPSSVRAIADELKDLTRNSYETELSDLSRTTGVRHLRIEVQKRPRQPAKPSGGRKR